MDKKSVRSILEDKIVIPEIQREYVWGANGDNPEIVRNFVLDVNNKLSTGTDFPLGFLYSYKHGGELHLIDGQQRMTTIVLLVFYCYCKEGCQDASVMRLLNQFSYRVRTDTEDFVFNLFSYADYFAKDLDLFKEDNLRNSRLFRSKYYGDKTIASMVKCLDTIHNLDDDGFKLTCNAVLDGLSFWTFEVGQTSQGEELYISMNSRGEALTSSELLKPRLFENAKNLTSKQGISWGKAWDNWEELLFSHLGDSTPDKVGEAMNVFLRCVIEIVMGKPSRNISPAEYASNVDLTIIEDYFFALQQLFDSKAPDFSGETTSLFDSSKSHLVLKTLIAILYHGESKEEVSRIYPIVKNWERRGQIKNESLLKLIHNYHEQQIGWLDFILGQIDPEQKPGYRQIDGVLNNHEWIKILRYQTFKDASLEEAYHSAENNTILNGYLRAVWYEAFDSSFEWTTDAVATFKKRYELFEVIFADTHIEVNLSVEPDNSTINNSLIARAMLAIKPFAVWISGQNYAFGWKGHCNYWRNLANQKETAHIISKLIDFVYSGNDYSESGILASLNRVIDEAKTKYDKGNALYYIINYPAALKARWEGHNVISFSGNWENFDIWVLEKDNAHSYYHNLFINLLHYLNPGKECIKKHQPAELIISNGLQIKCSYLQGWDVGYRDWNGDIEILKETLSSWAKKHRYAIIDNETTRKLKQFYIPRGDNEQMKLGQDLLDFISTINS